MWYLQWHYGNIGFVSTSSESKNSGTKTSFKEQPSWVGNSKRMDQWKGEFNILKDLVQLVSLNSGVLFTFLCLPIKEGLVRYVSYLHICCVYTVMPWKFLLKGSALVSLNTVHSPFLSVRLRATYDQLPIEMVFLFCSFLFTSLFFQRSELKHRRVSGW